MSKKFYEYHNGHINEMNQADTAFAYSYKECFLIYAEDKDAAFQLAMEHVHDNLPMETLYNIDYKGEHYDVVKNVVYQLSIKDLRTKTGLSQSKFAAYFDIPVRSLQEWEQGRKHPPTYLPKLLQRILALEKDIH